MKYKLLKDTPTHKAGTIFTVQGEYVTYIEQRMIHSSIYNSVVITNNPEWFEPVEEFKKMFVYKANEERSVCLVSENFATEEQAFAKKELMEHIYKFEEPEESRSDNCFYLDPDLDWCEENTNTMSRAFIDYHLGLVITNNIDKQDLKERIRLLNNVINSLKS